MRKSVNKILRWPPFLHALDANKRFNARFGTQFAGAITYFSVLSIVPILMFVCALIGMTLTVLRPDLLGSVQRAINDALLGSDRDLGESVTGFIKHMLSNWQGVGIVAILTAGYSGSGWVGNLKRAVRMMWRENPIEEDRKVNPIVNLLSNILIFLGLFMILLVGVGLAQAGSSASSIVAQQLGLSHMPGAALILWLASIFMTFIASWILVAFLFLTLPDPKEKAAKKTWMIGVTIGAILVTILQQLVGILITVFSDNAAAAIFGPIIIGMLLMNLLATVLLMVAAWIGTDLSGRSEISAIQDRALTTTAKQAAVALASAKDNDKTPVMVRQDFAERGLRAGLGVGYVIGAATGVGLGALIAAMVGFLSKLIGRD